MPSSGDTKLVQQRKQRRAQQERTNEVEAEIEATSVFSESKEVTHGSPRGENVRTTSDEDSKPFRPEELHTTGAARGAHIHETSERGGVDDSPAGLVAHIMETVL